jgi:hypothetical protein
MKQWIIGITAIVFLFVGAQFASADLINGGFETNSYNSTGEYTIPGWTINARDFSRYGIGGTGSSPSPKEGSYFAYLTGDVSSWTTISQTFVMNSGDILSGYAYYYKQNENDSVYVRIFDGNTQVDEVWTGTSASSGWENWTFTAPSTKSYTLVLGITEPSIQTMHGAVSFDGITLTSAPVPIPPTVWLLGAGLVGLAGMRRKFRK